MDPKALNALVHDREAASYDQRFGIDVSPRLGVEVADELTRVLGVGLTARPRAHRLLDVACGTGYLALGASAAGLASQIHATDLSVEMLRRTRTNATSLPDATPVRLAAADGEQLPYRDGAFDLVVARGALHHVPDPVAMLAECRRVAALGGTVVCLAEPTPSGERQVGALVGTVYRGLEAARWLARQPKDLEHERWELASMAANLHTFTREDLTSIAVKAGFTEVTVGTAGWAWILALGVHYYLAGEIDLVRRSVALRSTMRAFVGAAATFDRVIAERLVPAHLQHTVWAVLR